MDSSLQQPVLDPEHSVFLSHSGAQKEFVEALYNELKKFNVYAFFDKRCLPPAEKFSPLIEQAAKQCRVAVVVLSEEFLSSKWPMLEVDFFLKAGVKIFPLFFKVSCTDLKDESKLERWRNTWREKVRGDKRIEDDSWETAVREIRRINGEEYKQGLSEKEYRENVARKICTLVPPNLKFDDSQVQGRDRLCQVIVQKFDCSPPQNSGAPVVVGLYGMGGTGKTTLCKMLCNRFSKEFRGKVFHVELESFGSTGHEKEKVLEPQKKILRELAGETADLVDRLTDPDQGWDMLKTHMHKHDVFLALDNVWEKNLKEAARYLGVRFSTKSRVLVTSRSLELLERLVGSRDVCMGVPDLEKEEAIKIFLEAARRGRNVVPAEQMSIVENCVDRCHLRRSTDQRSTDDRHYHPLALTAMGISFQKKDPLEWKDHLERWRTRKYGDSVFSILATSYDDLDCGTKQIFLDAAVFAPDDMGEEELKSWLKAVRGVGDDADIEDRLSILENTMILQRNSGGSVSMHDLYLEFAKMKAEEGEFGEAKLCFYREGAEDFEGNSSLLRVGLPGGRFRSLDRQQLQKCSQLRVLKLDEGYGLERLDVAGLTNLRSLDLRGCKNLSEVRGMRSVEMLAWLRLDWCTGLRHLVGGGRSPGKLQNVLRPHSSSSRLPALQFLHAQGTALTKVRDLRMSSRLRVLNLSWCSELRESPALDTLTALERLNLSICSKLRKLRNISRLRGLKELDLTECTHLTEVPGLDKLVGLESLGTGGCSALKALPGLSGLTNLQKLDVADTKISTIQGIERMERLKELRCRFSLLKELPRLKGSRLKTLSVDGDPESECNADQVISNLVATSNFTALTSLNLHSLEGLTELPCKSPLWSQLEELNLRFCRGLRGLGRLGPFLVLRELRLMCCPGVEEMPDLSRSLRVETIVLDGTGISGLPSYLTTLTDLRFFRARECRRLPTRELLGLLITRLPTKSRLADGLAKSITDDYVEAQFSTEDYSDAHDFCHSPARVSRRFERDLAELRPAYMVSCLESLFERGMNQHAIELLQSVCWKRSYQTRWEKPKLTSFEKLQRPLMRALGRRTVSNPSWKPRWEPNSVGVEFIAGEEATGILAKCMEAPTSFLVMKAILEYGKHEEELSKCGFTQRLIQHIANQPLGATCQSIRSPFYERSILLEWSEVLLITSTSSTKLSKELKEQGAHDRLHPKIVEVQQDDNRKWRAEVLNALNTSLQNLA